MKRFEVNGKGFDTLGGAEAQACVDARHYGVAVVIDHAAQTRTRYWTEPNRTGVQVGYIEPLTKAA